MSLGNAFPRRSTIPDTVSVQGVWTGGGAAANCTKATGDWNRGIASVNYNAATGKYKITLVDVGQQIVKFSAHVTSATGAGPIFMNMVTAGFSSSAKTVDVEVNDGGGTLTDLATTNKIHLEIVFAKNGPDA